MGWRAAHGGSYPPQAVPQDESAASVIERHVDPTELLVRLRPKLRGAAYRMLSPDEHRHAEDLASEAWISVWRALPIFPGDPADETGVMAWCMAVARNRMRNWIRETLLAPTHGEHNSRLTQDNDLIDLVEAGEQLPGIQTAYHDGRVREAVDRLPARQREYVIARFWHGESTTSLQRRMSPSTWTRLKPKLADELEPLVTGSSAAYLADAATP